MARHEPPVHEIVATPVRPAWVRRRGLQRASGAWSYATASSLESLTTGHMGSPGAAESGQIDR
jgi:hypothetical protein